MAGQGVSWKKRDASLHVDAQPTAGFRPSDPGIIFWRDNFRNQNLSIRPTSKPTFKPTSQPGSNLAPRQSLVSPRKAKGGRHRFINNRFSEKGLPRLKSAEDSLHLTDSESENGQSLKRRRLSDAQPTKTILTTKRPLKNSDEVHRDIWRITLSYCDPRFLIEAKTIDRLMYDILSSTTSIWRSSRERHIPTAPPCPSRLTEQQYVDLLVGRGCQARYCVKKNVIAVAWPFLGRLCLDCLHEKTLKLEDLPVERQYKIGDENLISALPLGRSQAGKYIRSPDLMEDGSYGGRPGTLVLRSEFDQLEDEYRRLSEQCGMDTIKEWYDKKCQSTKQHMLEISAIETTDATLPLRHDAPGGRSYAKSAARKDFFVAEAAKLDPPVSEDVLDCMSAYHRAVNTGNPPSIRAWEILRDKILPFREQAERVAAVANDSRTYWSGPESVIDPYDQLIERRTQRFKPRKVFCHEQQFVIDLGKEELDKCLRAGVADSDLLLLTLKKVFDRYNNPWQYDDDITAMKQLRPRGLNYDGKEGRYILSFDDAVMIVQEVLEAAVPKGSGRGKVVFKSLRCIACAKDGSDQNFDFIRGMEHLYRQHSCRVGQHEEYWRYLQKRVVPYDRKSGYPFAQFPFYSTPWSRCLPLIPNHWIAASLPSWHPDDDWEYVRLDTSQAQSAFQGRSAKGCNTNLSCGFLGAVIHAVAMMRGVTLHSQAIIKIALQYAADTGKITEDKSCSIDHFMAAIPELQQTNPALDFKFMCGICMTDEANSFPGVHIKHTITMKQLYVHWQRKHNKSGLNWMRLLHLPSDCELLAEILSNDKQLQAEKDEIMAYAAQGEQSLKKRRNRKANAILGTRSAMSAFEQLFPKTSELPERPNPL